MEAEMERDGSTSSSCFWCLKSASENGGSGERTGVLRKPAGGLSQDLSGEGANSETDDPQWASSGMVTQWAYDFTNNRSPIEKVRKAQYAYFKWNEELKENELREEGKKQDIREYWTGVYQIIGFYSVFQGVIYQGVTAMASLLSCPFYRIPVILSVLASAATFVGIHVKLSSVLETSASLNNDIVRGQTLQSKIAECEKIDVTKISVKEFEDEHEKRTKITTFRIKYEQQLVDARRLRWILLLFLTVYSAMFSYLDFIVMCRGYS